tara:strand:- start:352 stop:990 length:639 start_codon:yes stop_codon:yes gene_type:complete
MMKKKMMAAGGNMKKKGYAAGGASGMKKKMMAAGGNMKKKAYAIGGASGMKKKMMQAGGVTTGLRPIPPGNKGLAKLDKSVRNTMGFMKKGGVVTKDMMTEAGYGTLRDFMNAFKFNEDTGAFVKRSRMLKRTDGKPPKLVKKPGESQMAFLQRKNEVGMGLKRKKSDSNTTVSATKKKDNKKKETNLEKIMRENKEAMAKTGGKSGRLKSS